MMEYALQISQRTAEERVMAITPKRHRIVLLSKTILIADTQRELFTITTEAIERLEQAGQEQGISETLIYDCLEGLPDFTPEPAEYQ